MRAAVAQLVEHLAVNEVVPGSSPGGGVLGFVILIDESCLCRYKEPIFDEN